MELQFLMLHTGLVNTVNVTKAASVHYAKLYDKDRLFEEVNFTLVPKLCTNIILDYDFHARHNCVEIPFVCLESLMTVNTLNVAKVVPASLFSSLNSKIATKSRPHNQSNEKIIDKEIKRLLPHNHKNV